LGDLKRQGVSIHCHASWTSSAYRTGKRSNDIRAVSKLHAKEILFTPKIASEGQLEAGLSSLAGFVVAAALAIVGMFGHSTSHVSCGWLVAVVAVEASALTTCLRARSASINTTAAGDTFDCMPQLSGRLTTNLHSNRANIVFATLRLQRADREHPTVGGA
jgi:hypothetical protein